MKDRSFPTILGIIFLLFILVIGVYLSTNKTINLSSKASASCEPINPQITNLTFDSFDFSYTTSTSCPATLSIDNKIYQDASGVSNTHYFKISNLSSNKSYQFSLISGGISYSRDEFNLTTTGKPSGSIPSSNLAWGKITNPNGDPVSGAIIYISIPGGQALSALSNKDGNWNVSLATSFNENKTDWFAPTSVIDEDIIIYSPDGKLTQLTNKTDNNDPVPDIIIGQNYFNNPSTPNYGNVGIGTTQPININLSLISPKESEEIYTLKPDIFGQGPANNTISLKLDSASTTVVISPDNTWHWSPPENLSLGSHQLIITYKNSTITRNFSVSPNEKYLSFTSTPSATLAPTIAITTPTIEPTIVPTKNLTKIPTIRTAKPSTTSGLYKSGEPFPTYFLIIFSFILFSTSIYYFRR